MGGLCRLFVCTSFFLLAIIIESSRGQNTCVTNKCCIGFREIERVCTECVGFFGEECSVPCPAGYYGRQCKTPCNCSSNETCNQFVGCRSTYTCGVPRRLIKSNLKWSLLIFLMCIQCFNLVFCFGYPLRKRIRPMQKVIITNMEKLIGRRLPFSDQRGKMTRNDEIIEASGSQPMHRSANYGHVGDGYHHIHFPN